MDLYKRALELKDETILHRRFFHKNAETGFDIPIAKQYIFSTLSKLGIVAHECGSGICAAVGNGGPCILLRADIDALPMQEESTAAFAAKNGAFHACGHDMHSAMLLTSAKILKENESKLSGTVKFMFQPAEEILEGAKDMIANNVLEDVKCAFMLHVMPNTQLETGTLIVPPSGIITPFCDNFTITLNGKSTHGGMPHLGIDLFSVSSLIILSLQNIKSRELNLSEKVVLSIGEISGGDTYNVIPDTLIIKGMIRSYSEDIRDFVKSRVEQIINGICISYNVKYTFKIDQSVVAFHNDENLRTLTLEIIKNNDIYYNIVKQDNELSGGSEDFAEVSKILPTNLFMLCAGKKDDGYEYNIHHPKTIFDPEVLKYGVAINVTLGIELSKKYK